MVQSDKPKKKAEVFDYTEFAYSKKVVEDFPKLIEFYEKSLEILYPYSAYTSVWHVIQCLQDSLTLCYIQYDYYKFIYETKGKIR